MATNWDWSPVLGAVQGLAQDWMQRKQYEKLLQTLGTGMQSPGQLGPFGGPSSAPPMPQTARREDDNGMPIPGAPAPVVPAQGMTTGFLPAGPGRPGEWDWMTPDRGPLGLGILPAIRNILNPQDGARPPGAGQGINPTPTGGGMMPPQMMDVLRKLPPQIGMPLLLQTMQQQMMPQGIKEVDPTKDLYDNAGRLIRKGSPAGKFGTRAQAGVNPETGKPDQFVVDEQGNTRWLGTGVAPKEGDPFTLNNTRYDAQGNPIVTDPGLLTPEAEEQQRRLRAAGRTSVSIDNNLGNSLASGVGGGAADILKESRSSAAGAVTAIETGNRILSALDSGKVITGPGASFRLFGAQLFGDPETLQQTRTVIQGLADATLASRGELKGQGQITEYEQKTLEKARSGNIDDLTAQEIRTIVRVNDRLARTRIQKHKTTLGNVKGADVPENFLNIYNVDEPPEYQAPKSAGAPVRIQSPDDYNKLPSGAVYIDPNGVQRTKR